MKEKETKARRWKGKFFFNNRAMYPESVPAQRLELDDMDLRRRWPRSAIKREIDFAKQQNATTPNKFVPVVIRNAQTIHGPFEPERITVVDSIALSDDPIVFGRDGQDLLFRPIEQRAAIVKPPRTRTRKRKPVTSDADDDLPLFAALTKEQTTNANRNLPQMQSARRHGASRGHSEVRADRSRSERRRKHLDHRRHV